MSPPYSMSIILICYAMTNCSQVNRFIDVEAQMDDETETLEEDDGCGKSYYNVINIFTLI